MTLNASDTFALGAGLFIFTGCIGFLSVALYVAYTKLEEMLDYLKNCPAVTIKAPFKNGGPWGRLFVLGGIVSVIKTPGLYIPDGGACIEDIARFPKTLKTRLIALYKIGGYFVCALMLYAAALLVDWSSMGPTRLGAVLLTTAAIPVWALLCMRLGKTQASTIITSFNNSSAIKIRVKLNAGGHFGKLVFIVAISIIVTCSRIFIRRGTIDPIDLRNTPRHLKLKLLALFLMGITLTSSLLALYLCCK